MYIDTANIEEIRGSLKTGVIKGITTNPTILRKGGKPRFEQIADIMELEPEILYVQLVGSSTEEMLADFESLMGFADSKGYNLGAKVPMIFCGLEVVKEIKLRRPEVKVLGTAIYSADQGILATIAGCDCLAPYVNRMQNNAVDPYEEIMKMRQFIDDRSYETEILAASFKSTAQITGALTHGAHTCTIPYELLVQMMNKDVAVLATEVFNNDAKAIG